MASKNTKKKPVKSKKSRKKKKKISLFYKISFSLLLLLSLVLAYFVILVSAKPKSIPYITNKIELRLKKDFGDQVNIDSTKVRFTAYGSLIVSIENLRIIHRKSEQEYVIPNIESEFSLSTIILGQFSPKKLKFISPKILIDNVKKEAKPLVYDGPILSTVEDEDLILKIFSMAREGKLPIRNFEIEDAKILIRDNRFDGDILLRRSQINAKLDDNKVLHIIAKNSLNLGKDTQDLDLSAFCQLNKYDDLNCELLLKNFSPKSVSTLHPKLNPLKNIRANLDIGGSFLFQRKEFKDIKFYAKTKIGSFIWDGFFKEEMVLSNFFINGEYNHKKSSLNISTMKADFLEDKKAILYSTPKKLPNIEFSLLISNLLNPTKTLDYHIKLQDIPVDNLDKYWPLRIGKKSRKWTVDHLNNGMIRDASIKFSTLKTQDKSVLQDINYEMNFDGLNVNYSKKFPEVKNLAGKAKFDEKSMDIAINKGEFLNSKITSGLVAIEDFSKNILNVTLSSVGDVGDSLRHIDYKSKKGERLIKTYFTGNSKSNIQIKLPLKNLSLKNSYIAINSKVEKIKNSYINGAINIDVKKNYGDKNFITNINLNKAKIHSKELNIYKKVGVESRLKFILTPFSRGRLFFNNLDLVKYKKGYKSRIKGDIWFLNYPFRVLAAEIENNNFGKNNYKISYKTSIKDSSKSLNIKGSRLDLKHFIENKIFDNPKDKKYKNSQIQIAVNNVYLFNKKEINSLYLSLKCKKGFCDKGVIKANNANKQLFAFETEKVLEKDGSKKIKGIVNDVGYVAEAFGISKIVDKGSAKFNMTTKIEENNQILQGKLRVDNKIVFYENSAVKKLLRDSLYSQVKDKIFSEEKTIFDSVKVDFKIKKGILDIDSLIANNYKVGITAKGFVNLGNLTYNIRGMIIPGFIVNNLFGIGKIPIIGNVVTGLLTGGEGGGLFGIRFKYVKNPDNMEPKFRTNKVSAFVPTTIRNLFDEI